MDDFRTWLEDLLSVALPNNFYLVLFLLFVVGVVVFVAWAVYYAFTRKAVDELDKITWSTRRNTIINSSFVLLTVVGIALLLFGYDFVLDKIVNTIINA